MDTARIDSEASATLLEIVRAAATAVTGPKHEPVGRLELTSIEESANTAVSIEASVSAHGVGWTVEQLDVRVRQERDEPLASPVLSQLIEQFGSPSFTSLTVFEAASELLDFTVSFSSRLPFLATNQLIARDDLSATELVLCNNVLTALGVRVHSAGPRLKAPGHQLRSRPAAQAQAAAFQLAFDKTRHVDLYTSALPATRAVRVEQRPGSTHSTLLDICISSGLGAGAPTTEQATSAERFVRQAFGLTLGDRSWDVRNTHEQAKDFRARGIVKGGPRKTWSLNWGQRK